MGREQTKQLTESALLMAVSIVLFFGAFIPFLGILIAPFSPLPLCILTVKYGLRHGLLVACVTEAVLTILFSVVFGVAFIPFVFVGLTLGTMAHRKAPGLRALVGGTVATLLLLYGLFALYETVASSSTHLLTIRQFTDQKFARATELLETFCAGLTRGDGGLAALLVGQMEMLRWLTNEVMRFPLAFFATISAIGFTFSYYAAARVLGKLGIEFPSLPPFPQWQGTRIAATCLIVTYLVTMYCWRHETMRSWRLYAINVLFLFLVYHIVLGFAVLKSRLEQWAVDPILRFITYMFVLRFFIFPPIPVLPVVAALDPWFDWRRLQSPAVQ